MGWLLSLLEALKGSINTLAELKTIAELLGLDPSEVNDPSEKCLTVLRAGLTPEVCIDFRGVRRWVLCRAWDLLLTKRANTFREAVKTAWNEAHLACGGKL